MDTSFAISQPDLNVYTKVSVSRIAPQPDGKILIGGMFLSGNQIVRPFVVRLMGEYAPLEVERRPHRDPGKPMLERRAAIELFQRPPRFEKSLLGQVFDLVGVPLIAMENGEDTRLMALDDFTEIVPRPISDASQ